MANKRKNKNKKELVVIIDKEGRINFILEDKDLIDVACCLNPQDKKIKGLKKLFKDSSSLFCG